MKKEQIVELIKNSEKSINIMDITNALVPNNTVDDLRKVMDLVDELCREGKIRMTASNAYVINELLTGKVDMHKAENAHIIIKGMDDIFVPKDKLNGAQDGDTVIVDIVDDNAREKQRLSKKHHAKLYDVVEHEEKDKKLTGRVIKVLNRSIGTGIGMISKVEGQTIVTPFNQTLPYSLELCEGNEELLDGQIVHLKYMSDISKRKVLVDVDEVIGHKDDPDNNLHILLLASQNHRVLNMPEEVENAEYPSELDMSVVEKELASGKLVDRRGELITTMDGKDTKDIDDATSTERMPNGNIHESCDIAAVSKYVKIGSPAWDYAEIKCFTDYYEDKSAPMLTRKLSNGICSLNPNENRYAITVEYELDNAGNIINPQVHFSVIKSKMKTNYDAVEDIIRGRKTEDTKEYKSVKYTGKKGETLHDVAFKNDITVEEMMLWNMECEPTEEEIDAFDNNKSVHEIIGSRKYLNPNDSIEGLEVNVPVRAVIMMEYKASKIMENRLKSRGKLDFVGKTEQSYDFDENRHVIGRHPRVQRESEEIIEHKMIYANEAFTMYMLEELSKRIPSSIPYIFRTHGEPNPKKLEDFKKLLNVIGMSGYPDFDPYNISNKNLQDLIAFLSDKENFKILSNKLLRCMQHAVYSCDANNTLHYALASNGYTHFTAPIRRLSDLIVQTLFQVFIVDEDYSPETVNFWCTYITNICEQITEAEKNNEQLEYDIQDYDDADYMTDHIGEGYDATISEVLPSACYAMTDDDIEGRIEYTLSEEESHMLEQIASIEEKLAYIESHKHHFDDIYNKNIFGYTHGGKVSFRLGDRVRVNCIDAIPENGSIDFALVRKR